MQLEFKPAEGSNLFDIILNTYTSLDLLPKFVSDNNITNLNMVAKTGDIFIYETDLIVDEIMLDKINKGRLLFMTSNVKNNVIIGDSNYLLIESGDILATDANINFLI